MAKRKQVTAKNNANTNEEINPITLEQLQDVQVLRRKIQAHGRHVNRFTSMVISVVTFPALINFAFNHSGFKEYLYEYFKLELEILNEISVALDSMELAYQTLVKEISQIGSNPMVTLIAKKILNFDEIIDLMDKEGLSSDKVDIKKTLIKLFNYYIEVYRRQDASKYLSADKIESYSLRQLFDWVKAERDYAKKTPLHKVYRNFPEEAAKLFSKVLARRTVVFSEIVLTMLAQYYLVDPLLNHYFPQGIFGPAPQTDRQLLTQQDYFDVSEILQELEEELSTQANTSIRCARYGLALALPLALMLLIAGKASPIAIIVALTLISTSLTSAGKDLSDYYQQKSLPLKLKQQEQLIKTASVGYSRSIQRNVGEDFNSSGFVVEFKQFEKDKEVLSAKKVAALFKECCIYHKVNVDYQVNNTVSLPARSLLSQNKAVAIKKSFSQSLERALGIRNLSNQIEQLKSALGPCFLQMFKIPSYDENHLPIVSFELNLSKETPVKLIEELKLAFPQNCQLSQIGDNYILKVSGSNALEVDKFRMIAKDLQNRINLLDKKTLMSTQQINQLLQGENHNNNNRGLSDSTDAVVNGSADTPSPVSSKSMPQRIIKWRSGLFDSQKSDNKIVPIPPRGQVRSDKTLAEATHFIVDELNYDLISPDLAKIAKEKVNSLMADPHFVPPKGSQGLVDWNRSERNQENKWMTSAYKGKFLGKAGNMRVYLEAEKAEESEETLLKIKGINFNSHK